MEISVRRARSSDVEFIAWAILMSQRGHRAHGWFDIALGWPETECLAFIRCLAAGPVVSVWHYSRYWIAEADGEPAATLCALPVAEVRATTGPAIEDAMQSFDMAADEQEAVWRRGAYIRECWTPGDAGNWLVEHVAARPAYRKNGLVQILLQRALDAGAAAGFMRAAIPFYIGNDPAERCYARAGFHFVQEKRHATFEALTGAPGFRLFERMTSRS